MQMERIFGSVNAHNVRAVEYRGGYMLRKKILSLINNTSDERNSLKSLLNHPEYKVEEGKIYIPFGITDDNRLVIREIKEITHMLIAGTTGSGKTLFMQTLLMTLVCQYNPDMLKFILFDSKQVDYLSFDGMPNLLIPILKESRKCIGALHWMNAEAHERIKKIKNGEMIDDLPHIFCVIDDLAEISYNKIYIEQLYEVLRLGRLTKIHCIISTSIPTVKIIPSELKALIHCRIAFSTATKSDSRVIIDENGAETLRAPGEIIFKNYNEMIRCDGIYLSEEEQKSVLKQFIDELNAESNQLDEINGFISESSEVNLQEDNIFEEAGKVVIQNNKASIGLLQRHLRIGFNKANKIMEKLEEAGVVGIDCGTKPRAVLMSLEQFEQYINENC